jgi:Domain of unknown function (DUF4224)
MQETSNLLLTDNELRELTEYKHRKKQQERLASMKVPFHVGRDGRPLVLRSAIDRHLGGDERLQKRRHPSEPDFTALK